MRDTPPYRLQYLFETVSQRGVSHPFALFSCDIAQVSLGYPFCGGGGGRVSHLHFACSPRGKGSERERGEVSHPIGHVGTPKIRKILAPIKKIKKRSPPPQTQNTPPPPLKRGILWTWLFLQNGRIFPGAHKIGAAISGPRIVDKNFTDTRIF